MAIEPISSIMTIQAQGSVNMKPQQPVASEKPEVVEASAASQEAAKVDNTIRSIENAQEKGNTGNDNKEQTASQEQLRKAVDEMNKNLANSEAIFGFHDKTNRVTIKIVDKTSKKVIKELPPEKTLDMIAKVWEMAGILVDERR